MGRVLVVTAACEGGYFSTKKDASAPIRIYSDRWVEFEADIIVKFGLPKKRQRLSRKEFRFARRAARMNRLQGLS